MIDKELVTAILMFLLPGSVLFAALGLEILIGRKKRTAEPKPEEWRDAGW